MSIPLKHTTTAEGDCVAYCYACRWNRERGLRLDTPIPKGARAGFLDDRTHELKTHPGPFSEVWSGGKRHEVRKLDRDFERGDIVLLREWEPATGEYTGRSCRFAIGYISRGPEWGLPEGLCVFSLVSR